MVAILGLDIDARIAKGARNGTQLTRDILFEASDQDWANRRHTKASPFERHTGSFAVFNEEVGPANPANGENATAFQAYACCPQCFTEACEGAWSVREVDCHVKHGC